MINRSIFQFFAFTGAFFLLSFPGDKRYPTGEPAPVTTFAAAERGTLHPHLQSRADALLKAFDDMPAVPVYLIDEPIIKTGTNTERGVAYTVCDNPTNPEIFVKNDFFQKTNQRQLTNIIKHELTHAYLCRQGQMWGHDELFRRKFKEAGGFGN